jgi:hypothetical protein
MTVVTARTGGFSRSELLTGGAAEAHPDAATLPAERDLERLASPAGANGKPCL